MGLETATYITDLVSNNPLGTDSKAQGDNHIRLLKSVLQTQFSSLGSAAVTATAAELNKLDGATATTAELNILSGVTATAAELNLLDGVTSIYDLVYPTGCLFETTNSANPSTYFTGTTWVRFGNGRVTVGQDSNQSEFNVNGETGGSKTHTLTVSEMPSHTHTSTRMRSEVDSNSGGDTHGSGTYQNTVTGSTGGNSAHNNLQPYVVVYRWKRTA